VVAGTSSGAFGELWLTAGVAAATGSVAGDATQGSRAARGPSAPRGFGGVAEHGSLGPSGEGWFLDAPVVNRTCIDVPTVDFATVGVWWTAPSRSSTRPRNRVAELLAGRAALGTYVASPLHREHNSHGRSVHNVVGQLRQERQFGDTVNVPADQT